MRIRGIIWLDRTVEKLLEKHGLESFEVREVLRNSPWFRLVEKGHRRGENVYSAFGQTDSGRYVIVFFVYKRDGRALILSAREMSNTERKTYERR